jgi:hypothetical protein
VAPLQSKPTNRSPESQASAVAPVQSNSANITGVVYVSEKANRKDLGPLVAAASTKQGHRTTGLHRGTKPLRWRG